MKDERSTAKLDALLSGLDAPTRRSDDAWDDAAGAIVNKAVGAGTADPKLIDSLLAAPALEPEAGEPSSVVGDSKMSSDRDPPSKAGGASGPTSKRPSLKELAERVSKTPPPPSVAPARASVPELPAATMKAGTSNPPTATPLPIAPPASVRVVEAPPPSAPVSGPPSSVAQASSPPPSAPAVAAKVAEPTSKAPATLPTGVTPGTNSQKEGSGKGGIVIALFVVAAAAAGGFFYLKAQRPPVAAQTAPAEQATAAPTAKPEEKPEPAKTAEAKNDKPSDGALDINALGDASAQPSAVALGGPLPAASTAPSAVAASDASKTGPVKVNPDGTLDDAMKKAAGPDDGKQEASPAAEAATPKNLPDAPPQGSVTAAIGAVKGAAKACVAGADDVSSATVTFGSSGAVQSVSVGGWAAGKPAASCIQTALKAANVGPFSKPTFTVPVTIRP